MLSDVSSFVLLSKLGLTGWPLLACSLIGTAIIVERIYFLTLCSGRLRAREDDIFTSLERNKKLSKPMRDEYAGWQLSELRRMCETGLRALKFISMISPMFGLLGTVLGIIDSFKEISKNTGPVSPALISSGLWEAMLTTAVGLSISLVFVVALHLISRQIERRFDALTSRLNEVSFSFESENLQMASVKNTQSKTTRMQKALST